MTFDSRWRKKMSKKSSLTLATGRFRLTFGYNLRLARFTRSIVRIVAPSGAAALKVGEGKAGFALLID